jgi:hypothetical protein
MEYNNNVYLTIPFSDVTYFGLKGRNSNDNSTTILEYSTMDLIPQSVKDKAITFFNHKDILVEILKPIWVDNSEI